MTQKALSIKQPWAWLIANGYKDIENREWSTKYRGEFLIHTGKKPDYNGYGFVEQNFPLIRMPSVEQMGLGGIVGKAEIVDCVTDSESEWFFGTYGFALKNATPFPFRAYRGQLGFFHVNIPYEKLSNA